MQNQVRPVVRLSATPSKPGGKGWAYRLVIPHQLATELYLRKGDLVKFYKEGDSLYVERKDRIENYYFPPSGLIHVQIQNQESQGRRQHSVYRVNVPVDMIRGMRIQQGQLFKVQRKGDGILYTRHEEEQPQHTIEGE